MSIAASTMGNSLTSADQFGSTIDASPEVDGWSGPPEIEPMRQLWNAVLCEQVQLVLKPQAADKDFEISAAHSWFRTSNFVMVCALAGVDPDYIRCGLRAQGAEI